MKRTISVVLLLCMVFSFTLTACAAENAQNAEENTTITLKIGSPVMTVNGEPMQIDEQGTVPVIVDNRTLLPVRSVVEKMGGTVEWNGETGEVTLRHSDDEIKLTVGSTEAYLNGEPKTLDVAPAVINDRTMLPIRFIAEGFRFSVEWNEDNQEVTVTKTENAVSEPAQQPSENTEKTSKSLVVYFSATGNTKALAEKIASRSGSDIFEIVPEEKYTSEDLNYNNSDCRANKEQNDESARPAISGEVKNIENYDTVFIGYPIWWGTMPKIINTFLETYDLSGKTVMPFCTSGGSGISSSVTAIKNACPGADVKDGLRGSSGTDAAEIEKWLQSVK